MQPPPDDTQTAADAGDGTAPPYYSGAGASGSRAMHNRVRAIMAHGWRYAFQPTERLARDAGVSPRTIRRLLSGETRNPPFRLVEAVVAALSRDLRRPPGFELTIREVFSPDGAYPTGSTCELCDCPGCLPEHSHDRHGRLKLAFISARPGDWCRYPTAEVSTASDGGSDALTEAR